MALQRSERAALPSVGPRFSWINPVPIWRSRNQYLSHFFGDPSNDERRRWMKLQKEAGELPEDLIIDQHADLEEVPFNVVGDTGEGDASQHAVVNFVCYPRRGDSLSFYSKLYDRRFGFGSGWLEIAPDEAAAYMARRLGIKPARPGDRRLYISRRTRRVAEWIFPLPGRGRGFIRHFSPSFSTGTIRRYSRISCG